MEDLDLPVADRLERFVRGAGHVADNDQEFNRQVNLFQSGYLDSIGVESLIVYIEREFRLELSDEALNDPSFASIDGISSIIDRELKPSSLAAPTKR